MPVTPDPFGSFLSGRAAAQDNFRQNQQLQSSLLTASLNRAVTAATAPLQIATLQQRLDAARFENQQNQQFGSLERQAGLNSQNALTQQRQSATDLNEINARIARATEQDTVATATAERRRQEALASAAGITANQAEALGIANIRATNALGTQRLTPSATDGAAARDAARIAAFRQPVTETAPPVINQATPAALTTSPLAPSPVRTAAQLPRLTTDTIANFSRDNSTLSATNFINAIRAQGAQGIISQQEVESIILTNLGVR